MIEQPQADIEQWQKTMKEYKETKRQLPWGKNPQVAYVSEQAKKEMDVKYNPILQRYNEWDKEEVVKAREHEDMIHSLAKNKVYNVIIRDRIVPLDMSRPLTLSRLKTS